ncbi:MAG: hypothetical protein RIR70_1234 [Pseudomonadota bacterium]|jgi:hypothetical protein
MADEINSTMPISYLDQNLYVCDHGCGLEVVQRTTGEGAFVPNEMGAEEMRVEMDELKTDPSLMADYISARLGGLFNKVSTH